MAKYSYSNRFTLNHLVGLISGENCEISAFLRPDIPEFIEAAEKRNYFHISSPIAEINKELQDSQLSHNKLHANVMKQLCEKHKIMPFWNLIFNDSFRPFDEPEIKYVGYNFSGTVYDEFRKGCIDPINFTKGYKWYGIEFEEIEGKEGTDKAKRAIEEFVKQGYIVTSLQAELEPYIVTTDHYCSHKRCKAVLWAGDGKVEFSGDIPVDMDEARKRGMLEIVLSSN